ncbi:MAG: hypothetical protein EOP51_27660, partial [Sphingobacteriales bacterium]
MNPLTAPALATLPGYFAMAVKSSATISNLVITPAGNKCTNVARNVTVTVTPGGAAITSVVINYAVNGTAQTAINMTNTSGNDWSGTIPTVTPSTGTVTWSVTATDANTLTKTLAGTPYTDTPSAGAALSVNATTASFCGNGGTTTVTVTSADPSYTYTWSALSGSPTLSSTTGSSIDVTVSATSDIKVTGTTPEGCTTVATYSIGVYPLPAATVTTTASGVCPGTSATIGSGLSARNFSASCITAISTLSTPPVNAVTLLQAPSTINTPSGITVNSTTNFDDNYWGNVPVGFSFNFFGTPVTNVFVGTNGTINLGTTGSTAFNFAGGFPNTANPASTIAVCARDLRWDSGTGTIKFWTEGVSPNRRFIVQFANGKPYSWTTGNQQAEAVFYETTGVIDIRVVEATNGAWTSGADNSVNKYIGLQDGTKTIGATAPNCATQVSNFWNGVTNAIPASGSQAWRFTPPSNYNVTWTASPSGATAGLPATTSGQNLFSINVSPTVTTTYSVSYTNQTTGCTNAPGSAQVVMQVLSNTPPANVTTTSTKTVYCLGDSVTLATDYTGIT